MKKALRRLIFCAILLPEFILSAAFAQTSSPYRLNSSPPDFVVDSIAPKKGPAWGGTTVTIYGKKFLPNATFEVRFGGIPGANVKRLDNQALSVKTPRFPLINVNADTLEVTVTEISETPNVTQVSPDSFIYRRPGTKLSLFPATADYNGNVELNAILTDSLNNPVDSQMVSFTLGGLLAGMAMTDKSGTAKLSASIAGLEPGVHTGYIGASFTENFYYKASTAQAADLTVKAMPLGLTVNSPVINYGESIELKATLTSSGAPLPGKTITFTLNNNPAGSAVTQNDGVASLPISQQLEAGVYSIKAVFAETGYDTISAEGTLTINQIPTSITVEKVETSPGSTVSLTAKLTANGSAVKNGEVTFSIDGGASLGSAATNDEGVATLTGVNLGALGIGPGIHTIAAAFAGNTNYKQSSGSNELIVSQEATVITISNLEADYGSTVRLSAKLTSKATGLGIKDAVINFQIEGGPQVESASTNENGEAEKSVNLGNTNSGTHNITASFAGNGSYGPSQASGTLTIKQASIATNLQVEKASGAYGGKTTLQARLSTSEGTGLSGMMLHFKLKGVDIGDTLTNGDGIARLHGVSIAGISAGLHENFVEVSFSPQGGEYNPSSGKGQLEVSRAATGISTNNVDAEFGSTITLTAMLTSSVTGSGIANGTVNFTIEDGPNVESVKTNSNGLAEKSVSLGSTAPGKHNITVSFGGGANYLSSQNTAILTITQTQIGTTLSVSNVETDGGTVTLSAKLTSNATGLGIKDVIINFTIEGGPQVEAATTNDDGVASKSVNLGNTSPGQYNITASFAGNASYGPSQGKGTLTIKQAPTATNIQVEKATGAYGGKVNLSAKLTTTSNIALSNMKLHFKLNGTDLNDAYTDENGLAVLSGVSIAGINAGLHENFIEVSFSPQGGEYNPSSGTGPLEVHKAETGISTSDVEAEFGASVTLTAALTSNVTGNGIANETVNFKIEGGPAVESAQTNSNGVATRSLSLGNTSPGKHNITVSFGETSNYLPSHKTSILTITQTQTGTSLTVSNVETDGGPVTLTAKLTTNPGGDGIPNETVSFSFNDGPSVGSGVTDGNGFVSLSNVNVPGNLGPGLYKGAIKASYAGSSKYLPSNGAGDLKINKAQTSITVSSASGEYGGRVNLRAILKSGDQILTGQTVKFYLNDVPAGDIPTGSNGAANISAALGSIDAGAYPSGVRAEFEGSQNYSAVSGTNSLTVNQASTKLSVKDAEAGYGSTVTLTATLTSSVTQSGIADKSISFAIQGGPQITAVTNGSGVASASVELGNTSAGTHEVAANFSPSGGNYKGSSGKGTLTIKGYTTSLAVSNVTGTYGGTVTLEASLSSSGSGLNGKTIKFTFSSKTYYAETDYDGIARVGYVSISGFDAGKYPGVIVAEFAGSGGYGYSSGSGNLTVEKASTSITVANVTGASGGKVDLSAELKSGSKKLKGLTVRFQLNNNPVGEAKTNDDGVATLYGVTLQGNLTPGPHPGAIAAVFDGTDNYFSVQGSGTLTIVQTPTTIQVTKATGSYGGKVNLSAKLTTISNVALGNMKLHFKLNGADVNDAYTDENGIAVLGGVSIAGIDAGIHDNYIQVSFSPANDNYAPSTAYGRLEVIPAATTVSLSNMEADFGSTVTLMAMLTSSVTGKGIEGRTILFKVDGAEVGSGTTGADGKAYKNYFLGNTSPGYHTVEALFSPYPGGNYSGSSAKAALNIKAALTALVVTNTSGIYGGNVTLEATLTVSGSPLVGRSVFFSVNGKSAGSAVTGSNGKAYRAFSLAGFDAGFYPGAIKADFYAQDGYQAATAKGDLTVKPAATLLVVKSASGTFGGTVDLSATLTSGEFSLTGRTISFKLNGAFVGNASTGTNGVATLQGVSLSGLNAGTYYGIIEVNFAASGNYSSSTGTGNLTVYQAPTTTVVQKAVGPYNGKVSLTARLTASSSGNALSGRTLYFKLNGVTKGSAVTDYNGVASLTDVSLAGIAVGVYSDYIEAVFSPSGGNYLSSSGRGTLEVGLAPTGIIVQYVKAVYGSMVTLTATLSSQGAPLGGKTVEFTLNNVFVGTAVTDAYGIAVKTNVDLSGIPAGVHPGYIGARFAEANPFKGCSGRADLEITKASTAAAVIPAEVQYSDQVTITAVVISAAQEILNASGGRIEFKYQVDNEAAVSLAAVTSYSVINGKLYFSYTFICTLAPCTYKILAYFTPADQANFEGSCNTAPWGPLVVKPEDALVEYSGLRYFSVYSLSNYTGLLTYSSAATDYPDAFRGNISMAKAEVREVQTGELYENGMIRGTNLPVFLLNSSDQTLGMVTTQSFNRRLGESEINNCGTTFSVYTRILGYYKAFSDPALISVCIPSLENISGGGFIISNSPAGKYRCLAGSKTSFGFSMKYSTSGKDARGQVHIVIHGEDNKIYQITANVINILSAYLIKDMPGKAASFGTLAELRDITDPSKPLFLAGGLKLSLEIYDDDKNNENDAIAITLQDASSALLYSSNWNGTKTVSQTLSAPKGGGLIRVLSLEDPVSVEEEKMVPKEYALYQNYPNPFNPSTNIQFDLPEESRVSIVIYNVLGREVAKLVDKDFPAGRHLAVWNSQNGSFASGVYILRISAKSLSSEKSLVSTKKMMLIK